MATVATVNPATMEELPKKVPMTPVEDVPKIFEKARIAQKQWAAMSFKERARCCYKIKDFLAKNAQRGAEIVSKSNGKTLADALQTEILPCLMAIDWYAGNAEGILKPKSIPCGHILFANKANTIQHVPVGVVGIISPWNYPFSIPFGEVIMGLMAGNAILLKVATESVLVGDFIDECIKAGGLPEGLFAHLVLRGSQCSSSMFANNVNKIFFTGSVPVGKQLMKDASETLTPLSLELGGNDPALVLEDADLERASNGILWAGFQNAGQSCGGVERVYVARKVYDKFLALMIAKTKALKHGDPSSTDADIGAISTKKQKAVIEEHLKDALAKGATIAAQSTPVGDVSKGLFVPATLITNPTDDMLIMKEETFGPIIPLVPFDTVEEAIRMANNSDLALTSSVWTENAKLGRKVAEQIETGVTTINDHLYTHGCAETPWGGWKLSGLGRTHGEQGLHEMTNAKCINTDILPSKLIPRDIWWFPQTGTVSGMLGAISFVAPRGFADRMSGLAATLKFATPKMFAPWIVDPSIQSSNVPWMLGQAVKVTALIGIPVAASYYYKAGL
eukprot:TRINITY_DN6715_c0_g1_i1.p1 TRINITY_DN6715_c0_g1~~TRINITY_DN6715_c0_g1_i1.p1  ORF type:complete len:576 (+),score=159.73 TRINITY_DN6715_c0_g1_i1:40-1728(+)